MNILEQMIKDLEEDGAVTEVKRRRTYEFVRGNIHFVILENDEEYMLTITRGEVIVMCETIGTFPYLQKWVSHYLGYN